MEDVSIEAIGILQLAFLLLVGTPLILGIIDYERFGGDPLKRNLIDMVRSTSGFGLQSLSLFS